MRFSCLVLFCLVLAGTAAGQDRRWSDPDAWRLTRDEAGVVRISRADRKDGLQAPVARGGTPRGFLLTHRAGVWWLFLAGPDLIVAGRSKTVAGPYLDHKGRTLLDRGGTIVSMALPHDKDRRLIRRTAGERVDRLESSDGVLPLVWPPGDGYPLVGRAGSIDSWETPVKKRWPFAGPWRHSVDLGGSHVIYPKADGTIHSQPPGTGWKIEGDVLALAWPRGDAPGGVWTDRCRISADGRYYLGRNQRQAAIVGEVVFAENRVRPDSRRLPIAFLPEAAWIPKDRLTVWADFEAARDGWVPVYVVNRTKKAIKLPAQDGDIYLKLMAKSPEGDWERAQGHRWSWCGNSYFYTPEIPPGHFLVVRGVFPKSGDERAVRYRLMGGVDAFSNEGVGRVSPKVIEACRTDRMALRDGDFTLLSEVALGEVKPLVKDRVDLRVYAVGKLAERFADDPRTKQILRQLLSDPDPKVAAAARSGLDRISLAGFRVREGDLALPQPLDLLQLHPDPRRP